MRSPEPTYQLVRSDREAGLRMLFELYARKLLAYSTHHWKTDEDAAWDLIYKTMYRVADVVHEYEFANEEKFASFIFRIFINYLRNQVRDRQTAANGTVEVELNEQIIEGYPAPQKQTNTSQPLHLLQQELERLEDWQRILLLMRSQEVPYSEIARLVGKPESQLKVYYGRLKDQLAQRLNAQLKKMAEEKNG